MDTTLSTPASVPTPADLFGAYVCHPEREVNAAALALDGVHPEATFSAGELAEALAEAYGTVAETRGDEDDVRAAYATFASELALTPVMLLLARGKAA